MINFSEILWKSGWTKSPDTEHSAAARSDEFQVAFGLCDIPVERVELDDENRLALLTDPRGVGADRLRLLRMRLRALRELAKLRSIVITSPMPHEGKSTIAMSLATALAEGGQRAVLLVEADLHVPTLAMSLGLSQQPGLAGCLEDGLDPLSQLRKVDPFGWYSLQAGCPRGNPSELLQSDEWKALAERLSPLFEWIVIDSPPVLHLTDALFLSRHADATLLVARADRTPRESVEQAISLVGSKNVLGVVLNGADNLTPRYSKYYRHDTSK